MKYYAVTNDPAELMHYGVKGMKWGVIRTDAQLGHPRKQKKPRSAAYKKAQSKLGKMMKSGIKKAQANWEFRNSPENKAYRAFKKEANRERRAINKAEKKFEKHLQLAREGRLKYKGISDSEVGRIQNRLQLERNARMLSGAEKSTFGRRLKESIGEGIVQGVGSGVGRRVSERISRSSTLKTDRLRAEQNDRFERERERRRLENARREADYKAERDFQQQQRKDAYEHARDAQYQRERAKDAYMHDVNYDSEGKLSGSDYAKLYVGKYADTDKDYKVLQRNIGRTNRKLMKADERRKRSQAKQARRTELSRFGHGTVTYEYHSGNWNRNGKR